MTLERLLAALDLPGTCLVDRRVPKKLLIENAAVKASDKRLINNGIEEVSWVAAVKPTTIAVPAYRDESREYLEIAVVTVTLRPSNKTGRLQELVHRAIPYPVVLLTAQGKKSGVCLAHKRYSQSDSTQTVLDGDLVRVEWNGTKDNRHDADFVDAFSLARQPQSSLFATYQGLIETVVALEAARRTGTFKPISGADAKARHEALQECSRLEIEIAKLGSAARKERQVTRRIELNLKIKRKEAQLGTERSKL